MARARSGRFLVVDDEDVWRRTGVLSLSPFGSVVTASTVAEAHAALDAHGDFTGYVVDLVLPDGSGFEILTTVRSRGSDAKALVLTGHHERPQINRARDLRSEFLCKPVETSQLTSFGRRAVILAWTRSARITALLEPYADERQLSPRETEIVAGAVTGLPRRLVAEQLGVSENTLKVQIRHLLLKCGEASLDALADTVLRRAFTSPWRGPEDGRGNAGSAPPR
jgi:DNA-binding NarL/FixJ family response regulator